MSNQLWFGFERKTIDDLPKDPIPAAAKPSGVKHALQRAVLRWLLVEDGPAGAAFDVPTRILKFRADVAAFWNKPVRNPLGEGPGYLLRPTKSVIVQCYTERGACWADCTKAAEILPLMDAKRQVRDQLEAAIREAEPELRDPNALFEEYAEWHYEKSLNPAYGPLRDEIHQLEHALLEGTTFEQIRSAEVADQLYLAVPAGLVKPTELADGWGLLWVEKDLGVTVMKEAEARACHDILRLHLVQNIAAAATRAVMFGAGVSRRAGQGKVCFVKPPRGHRRPQRFRLD